jgi:polysaccharide export outer membrane protein
MSAGRRYTAAVMCFLFLIAVLDVPLYAQQVFSSTDYRVGIGDRIFMSVDQRADLNRELTVQEGGVVNIPLIGDVSVAGLTLAEIEVKLLDALKDYYPSVSRLTVTLREAVSQVIYITGQVGTPGKYNFTTTPNLWEAIREAGGATPTAHLEAVRVVKDPARGGTSTVYNVQQALETGSVDQLPDLEAGDTVIVPTAPAAAEEYSGSFGVNVFGSVVTPGTYRLQSQQDLISAILQAGGPIPMADLNKVNIIRPKADGSIGTITVDFAQFLDFGNPFSNPKLRPGDTVYVPQKGRVQQLTEADMTLVLTLMTTTLSVIALTLTISDRINNE